ncbi:MAG: hypothetical protein KDA75_05665 [Planctomycetaceae bacterium]|nr:hypothetical protein [Planctomycetaceae bacterium]
MTTLGLAVVVIGLILEAIAFLAMVYYPLRRALPFQSPLQLQSLGCAVFAGGVLLLLVRHIVTNP